MAFDNLTKMQLAYAVVPDTSVIRKTLNNLSIIAKEKQSKIKKGGNRKW